MKRWNFQIRQNKAPERCEVCHQTDMFDRQKGICLRCSPLSIEELVNPVFVIPISKSSTFIAAVIAFLCFTVGFLDAYATSTANLRFLMFHPMSFYNWLIFPNILNLPLSYALFLWCKDKYNERLLYSVVVAGRIASAVGLIGSGIGLVIPLPGILTRM
jgi:hypothetical protein